MNKILRVLVVVVLAVAGQAAALAQEGGVRYSITVTQFENRAGWHGRWDIGTALSTVLTDMTNQSGKFIVAWWPRWRASETAPAQTGSAKGLPGPGCLSRSSICTIPGAAESRLSSS